MKLIDRINIDRIKNMSTEDLRKEIEEFYNRIKENKPVMEEIRKKMEQETDRIEKGVWANQLIRLDNRMLDLERFKAPLEKELRIRKASSDFI